MCQIITNYHKSKTLKKQPPEKDMMTMNIDDMYAKAFPEQPQKTSPSEEPDSVVREGMIIEE